MRAGNNAAGLQGNHMQGVWHSSQGEGTYAASWQGLNVQILLAQAQKNASDGLKLRTPRSDGHKNTDMQQPEESTDSS